LLAVALFSHAGAALTAVPAPAAPGASPAPPAATAPDTAERLAAFPVLHAAVRGPITPATEQLLSHALARAEEGGYQALLLELDTPGGLVTSMRAMVSSILGARIPVLLWVGPNGARATSAGVFLVAAAHVAAMSPQTTIGAASPVEMGGKDVDPTMAEKIKNDLMSYVRGLAESRGRNSAWYQDAVDAAVSVTAQEAVMTGVVEMLADSPRDMLAQLAVRGIPAPGGTLRFDPQGVRLDSYDPGLRHRMLSWLLDPQIAYLLLLGGIAGLFFEFTTPGAILPGVLGGLSLLLALYALSILPTSTAGILLILFAVVLFVLEIFVTSFGMLSIAGLVALFLGSLILITPTPGLEGVPLATIIVTVTAVAAIMSLCLVLITRAQRRRGMHGLDAMIGLTGRITKWDRQEGQVFVRGESWKAVSSGEQALAVGDRVRVVAARGLTLTVAPENQDARESSPSQ
jgi:membrane-bound serine protease (ClpP class)